MREVIAAVKYPASLVHWLTLALAKFEVVRPETARAFPEIARPLPVISVSESEPTMRRERFT